MLCFCSLCHKSLKTDVCLCGKLDRGLVSNFWHKSFHTERKIFFLLFLFFLNYQTATENLLKSVLMIWPKSNPTSCWRISGLQLQFIQTRCLCSVCVCVCVRVCVERETTDKACLLCDPRRKAYEWAAVSAATVCISLCWCQIPTELVPAKWLSKPNGLLK